MTPFVERCLDLLAASRDMQLAEQTREAARRELAELMRRGRIENEHDHAKAAANDRDE